MELKTSLPVNISKHGKRYVAYTPALDLSTSGKNMAEVKRRFSEVVELFFEELQDAGTLTEVLTELGWKRHARVSAKSPAQWQPPEATHREFQVAVPAA